MLQKDSYRFNRCDLQCVLKYFLELSRKSDFALIRILIRIMKTSRFSLETFERERSIATVSPTRNQLDFHERTSAFLAFSFRVWPRRRVERRPADPATFHSGERDGERVLVNAPAPPRVTTFGAYPAAGGRYKSRRAKPRQ